MSNDFKEKYTKTFANIKADDDLRNRILQQTQAEKKKIRPWHKVLSAAACIVCIIALSNVITFAATGKCWIRKTVEKINITFFDGENKVEVEYASGLPIRHIPAKAEVNLEESGYQRMFTLAEVEDLLDVSFLHCSESDTGEVMYYYLKNMESNTDKIAMVDIGFELVKGITPQDFNVYLRACFLSEEADRGYRLAVEENENPMAGVTYEVKYHSDNLDTDVIISLYPDSSLNAMFIYDNILYDLTGNNVSESEMKELIETLRQ